MSALRYIFDPSAELQIALSAGASSARHLESLAMIEVFACVRVWTECFRFDPPVISTLTLTGFAEELRSACSFVVQDGGPSHQ